MMSTVPEIEDDSTKDAEHVDDKRWYHLCEWYSNAHRCAELSKTIHNMNDTMSVRLHSGGMRWSTAVVIQDTLQLCSIFESLEVSLKRGLGRQDFSYIVCQCTSSLMIVDFSSGHLDETASPSPQT